MGAMKELYAAEIVGHATYVPELGEVVCECVECTYSEGYGKLDAEAVPLFAPGTPSLYGAPMQFECAACGVTFACAPAKVPGPVGAHSDLK
jgi:hypothetical protein